MAWNSLMRVTGKRHQAICLRQALRPIWTTSCNPKRACTILRSPLRAPCIVFAPCSSVLHRHHMGHSHSVPPILDVKATRAAKQITAIGMGVNVGLAASKGIVGYLINSASLLADSVHSFTDLLSDFCAYGALIVSRRPPNERFPYGYGRVESITTVLMSCILFGSGGGMFLHSLQLLMQPTLGISALTKGAMAIAAMSIASKEALYQATVRVGKRQQSDLLIANAWHHRIDAWSSVVALLGICGRSLGIGLLDPVGGILVSSIILRTGLVLGWDAAKQLMDCNDDARELHRAAQRVLPRLDDMNTTETLECVDAAYNKLRVRRSGPFVLVDVGVTLFDDQYTIENANLLADKLKSSMTENVSNIQEVLVYFNSPCLHEHDH